MTDKIVVVYNDQNHESILAAAMVQSIHQGYIFKESTVNLPDDGDCYVWIGVQPSIIFFAGGPNAPAWKAKHIVSYDPKHLTVARGHGIQFGKIPDNPVLEVADKSILEDNGDILNNPSLIQKTLALLEIDPTPFAAMITLAPQFYKEDTQLDVLTMVYINVMAALSCLDGSSKDLYAFVPFKEADQDTFLTETEKAIACIPGRYRMTTAVVDKKPVNVFLTCFTKDYWLLLRRILLTNTYYINLVMTVNGLVIRTNLKSIKDIQIVSDHIKLG